MTKSDRHGAADHTEKAFASLCAGIDPTDDLVQALLLVLRHRRGEQIPLRVTHALLDLREYRKSAT